MRNLRDDQSQECGSEKQENRSFHIDYAVERESGLLECFIGILTLTRLIHSLLYPILSDFPPKQKMQLNFKF